LEQSNRSTIRRIDMTTITTRSGSSTITTGGEAAVSRPARPKRSRAVAVRRWLIVASPVLAGVFAVVGAAADPGAGISGRDMWQLYATHPGPLQLKSMGFHWSYALWIAPALLLAAYVKGKGAWIANVAAVLGFAGMTTLPGLLFVDWYDSAIGQLYGVDGTARVNELMGHTMWGPAAFTLPGMVGFMLALPLAALALWRAGLVRWWAPLSVLAGYGAFMLSNVMWWGCAITTVCFAVFAVALERATRPTSELRA
jgi:hypothetical protein